METTLPIGVFDSGVGGLSVWREIIQLLPHENTLYLADTLNCPYGGKSTPEIVELSVANTRFLVNQGCKLIVVACNTATANAIHELRHQFSIPIVGIEPAIKPASLNTKTKRVGVLATKGTFNGRLFVETSERFADGVTIHKQIGEGLVELVEQDLINTPETERLLKLYLQPMLDNNIDKLVLGCTHYPFLMPVLSKLIPSSVEVINPAPAVAQRVKQLLTENKLLSTAPNVNHRFFTTGDKTVLTNIVTRILGASPQVSVI